MLVLVAAFIWSRHATASSPPPLPTMRPSVAWPYQVMKEMNFESMPHTLDLNSKMFHSMSATLMYSLFKKRYMMEQNWRNVFIGKDLSCGHVAFAWQNEIIFGIFKTAATICVVFLWKYCSSALNVRTNLSLYRDTLPPPKDSVFRLRWGLHHVPRRQDLSWFLLPMAEKWLNCTKTKQDMTKFPRS